MINITPITPRPEWFLKPEMFQHIGVDERYEATPLMAGMAPGESVIWEVSKISTDRKKAWFDLRYMGVLMAIVTVTLEGDKIIVTEV